MIWLLTKRMNEQEHHCVCEGCQWILRRFSHYCVCLEWYGHIHTHTHTRLQLHTTYRYSHSFLCRRLWLYPDCATGFWGVPVFLSFTEQRQMMRLNHTLSISWSTNSQSPSRSTVAEILGKSTVFLLLLNILGVGSGKQNWNIKLS